jgi:hypothetical protein
MTDGIEKGGRNDPVAQSIRNQQMRDAAPSKKERAEASKERNTCDECGEYNPDEVRPRWMDKYDDDEQLPPVERAPPVYCDDCAPEVDDD